jgi:beta-lactamase regulating signal transducer with metallopeptidase domain
LLATTSPVIVGHTAVTSTAQAKLAAAHAASTTTQMTAGDWVGIIIICLIVLFLTQAWQRRSNNNKAARTQRERELAEAAQLRDPAYQAQLLAGARWTDAGDYDDQLDREIREYQ